MTQYKKKNRIFVKKDYVTILKDKDPSHFLRFSIFYKTIL